MATEANDEREHEFFRHDPNVCRVADLAAWWRRHRNAYRRDHPGEHDAAEQAGCAADGADEYVLHHHEPEYDHPAITERHHGSEIADALECTHVDAVGDTEQNHDEDDQPQHPKLPIVERDGLVVEIGQFAPFLDFELLRVNIFREQAGDPAPYRGYP